MLVVKIKFPSDDKRDSSRNVHLFTLQPFNAAANPDSFSEFVHREA